MAKTLKILFCLLVVALVVNDCGISLAEAANNESVLAGGFGLSSVDSDLQRLIRGIANLARPIVTIMTALAGMMVVLNIGGDHKQKMWNWILGIGLALNIGSILWTMWGGYADINAGKIVAAEYSMKVYDESNLTDGGIDVLSQFMKYYLAIVVAGALTIKPIAIKLLLGLAVADMSLRLALDLTDKDKVSWMVKSFLKVGFYVFLIHNWLGVDGLNLMGMLSKGFQEIGFMAGNYGEAPLTSITNINGIDPKHNLAPDSIVNNMYKMFSMLYSGAVPQDGSFLDKAEYAMRRYFSLMTSPVSHMLLALSMLIAVIVAFLTAVEMFMARIEFYTLALLAMPLLAFGVVKPLEYLAQQAIRAVFNCGVKVCVISFLQAVICQMFSKYTHEIDKALAAGPFASSTGTFFELLSMTLQLLLAAIIMFLIVSKVPKLIQGLLSGNPSMSGSDMTGAVTGTVGTAAAAAGMVACASSAAAAAKASGKTGWRMSAMGQIAASMLAKAPVTGSAYSAYTGVTRANWNNLQRNEEQQDRGKPQDAPTPAVATQAAPQQGSGTSAQSGGGAPLTDYRSTPDVQSENQETTPAPTAADVKRQRPLPRHAIGDFKKFPHPMKKKKKDSTPSDDATQED